MTHIKTSVQRGTPCCSDKKEALSCECVCVCWCVVVCVCVWWCGGAAVRGCVVVCVCRVLWHAENPPCVDSKRLRV